VDITADLSDTEWSSFLSQAPDANIFQSPLLARAFRRARGHRPHVLAALSGGVVRALLSGVIVSYSKGRVSPMTSRAIVAGGPIGNPTAFPALLAAHDAVAAKRALLTQIRNLRPPPDGRPFETAGYRWEDHLNFVLDLRAGEEPVLAGMSKARRKGISRAERSGLTALEPGLNDVDSFYPLLLGTYERAKVPLADASLFRSVFEASEGGEWLWSLTALHEGRPCAVRLCLRSGPVVYDWYAGSSDEGRSLHADEWLVWEVLRRAIRAGCTAFDFQGAGAPGEAYGPGEFKRRFGGAETNPGRFEKVYRPLTLKVSKIAYELWRRW